MAEKKPVHRTTLVGTVVSDKMNKTVVVEVETRKPHPLYRRIIRKTKRFKAHDEHNEARVGDVVRIVETRPISKEKHFRVVEIVRHREVAPLPEEVAETTAIPGA